MRVMKSVPLSDCQSLMDGARWVQCASCEVLCFKEFLLVNTYSYVVNTYNIISTYSLITPKIIEYRINISANIKKKNSRTRLYTAAL